MTDSEVLSGINNQLELITFIETEKDTFQLVGDNSHWLLRFCPTLAHQNTLVLKNAFDFLEGFIEESRERFQTDESTSLGSGPWSERDLDGIEQNLSATALQYNERLVIQMRRVPRDQLYHHRIFQKAREYSLDYERLQREKDQKEVLVFAVIHDLSSPLTSISGIIEVLSHTTLPEEERARLFRMAIAQIKSTHDLINSILNVFDEQDHRFDPKLLNKETAPHVTSIVESVVDNFRPVFSQQTVAVELHNSLPDKDVKVVAESMQLTRLLSNLLENALRYSPVNSKVIVTIESSADQILIRITDQGYGVAEELVAGLFQRFVGGKKYGGKAGFGLYYCHMCAKKWGGSIEYLPNGGNTKDGEATTQGACFQLALQRFDG